MMWPPVSHPLVHPYPAPPAQAPAQGQGPALVEAPPAPAAAAAQPHALEQGPAPAPANAPPGPVYMVVGDYPGVPGTRCGLALRLAQALLAAAALAAMASADGFASVTAFRYLVPAAALQSLWSLTLAAVDVYALLVGRFFRTPRALGVFVVGDWITGALTLSAASASAGITVLINDDLEYCYGNPCPRLMAGTAMAFLSWFALAPCCFLNFGTLVYKLQRL